MHHRAVKWYSHLAVALFICLSFSSAHAVVLVSDDFSAQGSGTGWQGNDVWGDGSTVFNGILEYGDTGARRFETPIDLSTIGRVYVAFDYAQTTPGTGIYWGGLTMYEPNNDEAFFLGNPWGAGENGIGDYSLATNAGNVPDNILHSNTDIVDGSARRLIAEFSHLGASISYRLWDQDNLDLNVPLDELTVPVADSPINAPWAFVAFRADGSTTNTADNLVIGTSPVDVGLSSSVTFQVDRSTGEVVVSSSSSQANVVSYTIGSSAGGLNPDGWTSIAGNYDSPAGNGSVDDTAWMVNIENSNSLSESAENMVMVDGATFGGSEINLGNAWVSSPFQDLDGIVLVNHGGQIEAVRPIFEYFGSHTLGDLTSDGMVNADDWAAFKSGQNVVEEGMSLVEAYQLGDMDADFDHDLNDFRLFQDAFDDANGSGAFAAMVSGVPEPTSVVLAGLALLLVGSWKNRSKLYAYASVALVTVAGMSGSQAEVYVDDTFSYEGSGSGWVDLDYWGNVADGTSQTVNGNFAFRNPVTPINPFTSGEVYIAFDLLATNPGEWGGVALFDEDGSIGGNYGNETLFIGTPGGYTSYGIALNNPDDWNLLPADAANGVPVDNDFHRLITKIDFDEDNTEPFQDTYSFWVDNYDSSTPMYSITIENSPVVNPWKAVRIAAGQNIEVDNLVITDDPNVAFAKPLELVVDTTTGMVEIRNSNQIAISFDSYSISSESGMISTGGAADGDFNSDGTVNIADYVVWRNNLGAPEGTLPNDPHSGVIGSDQFDTWKANFGLTGGEGGGWMPISDQTVAGFPSGTGDGLGWEAGLNPDSHEVVEYFLLGSSELVAEGSIGLGPAYSAAAEGDLVFSYQLDGEQRYGTVTYVTPENLTASAVVPEPTSVWLAFGMLLSAAVSRKATHQRG